MNQDLMLLSLLHPFLFEAQFLVRLLHVHIHVYRFVNIGLLGHSFLLLFCWTNYAVVSLVNQFCFQDIAVVSIISPRLPYMDLIYVITCIQGNYVGGIWEERKQVCIF